MGAKTVAELVAEAGKLAGNDAIPTVLLNGFNNWLNKTYKSFRWPFLQQKATGVVLPASSTSLLVGGGTGGVAAMIARIHNPIRIYDASMVRRGNGQIQQLLGGPLAYDETVQPVAQNLGMPTMFKIRDTSSTVRGQRQLLPFPFPDQQYLLAFDYQVQPANLIATSTPVYPQDETMVAALEALAVEYEDGKKEAMPLWQDVRAMVVEDRNADGDAEGLNDLHGLDPNVFK